MFTLRNGHAQVLSARREFLRMGSGFAVAGLSIPPMLLSTGVRATPVSSIKLARNGAKSCILVYLLGGPPHLDMFDLKPHAPAEIRGPFRPISTCIPGVQICELMPQMAKIADKYAIIRSVSHRNSNHTPMIYYTLTGRETAQPSRDNDIRPPQADDFPHTGCVLSRFKPSPAYLPGCVAIPELAIRSSLSGQYKRARTALRGGAAGFLGAMHAPLSVDGEPGTVDAIPALSLPEGVSAERFQQRAALLSLLDQRRHPGTQNLEDVRSQAVVLTGSSNRGKFRTFSLSDESVATRDRYGRHRFGQAMLLARRLAEAGVPMVAIHFNEMTICDGWDTHKQNFGACRTELLPMLDQSLSALIEDLHHRGRLDETVVACLGEFGRTPKINKNAGRDHWGECSSAILAGGGIHGGFVLGSSDKHAAHPATDPVDPVDIQATIYDRMGLDPHQLIYDRSQRPWPISSGRVIGELL